MKKVEASRGIVCENVYTYSNWVGFFSSLCMCIECVRRNSLSLHVHHWSDDHISHNLSIHFLFGNTNIFQHWKKRETRGTENDLHFKFNYTYQWRESWKMTWLVWKRPSDFCFFHLRFSLIIVSSSIFFPFLPLYFKDSPSTRFFSLHYRKIPCSSFPQLPPSSRWKVFFLVLSFLFDVLSSFEYKVSLPFRLTPPEIVQYTIVKYPKRGM